MPSTCFHFSSNFSEPRTEHAVPIYCKIGGVYLYNLYLKESIVMFTTRLHMLQFRNIQLLQQSGAASLPADSRADAALHGSILISSHSAPSCRFSVRSPRIPCHTYSMPLHYLPKKSYYASAAVTLEPQCFLCISNGLGNVSRNKSLKAAAIHGKNYPTTSFATATVSCPLIEKLLDLLSIVAVRTTADNGSSPESTVHQRNEFFMAPSVVVISADSPTSFTLCSFAASATSGTAHHAQVQHGVAVILEAPVQYLADVIRSPLTVARTISPRLRSAAVRSFSPLSRAIFMTSARILYGCFWKITATPCWTWGVMCRASWWQTLQRNTA